MIIVSSRPAATSVVSREVVPKIIEVFVSCTQTKTYEEFTQLIIYRLLTRHNNNIEILSLKGGKHNKYFDDLCRLAFNTTINSKQVQANKN